MHLKKRLHLIEPFYKPCAKNLFRSINLRPRQYYENIFKHLHIMIVIEYIKTLMLQITLAIFFYSVENEYTIITSSNCIKFTNNSPISLCYYCVSFIWITKFKPTFPDKLTHWERYVLQPHVRWTLLKFVDSLVHNLSQLDR